MTHRYRIGFEMNNAIFIFQRKMDSQRAIGLLEIYIYINLNVLSDQIAQKEKQKIKIHLCFQNPKK